MEKMLGSSVPSADVAAPVGGATKKQKKDIEGAEVERESGPAWMKGDYLTGSASKKDATGWDQIAEEEEEAEEEAL